MYMKRLVQIIKIESQEIVAFIQPFCGIGTKQ